MWLRDYHSVSDIPSAGFYRSGEAGRVLWITTFGGETSIRGLSCFFFFSVFLFCLFETVSQVLQSVGKNDIELLIFLLLTPSPLCARIAGVSQHTRFM